MLMEGSPTFFFFVAFQYYLCFQVKNIFVFEWRDELKGTVQFTRLKIMGNDGGSIWLPMDPKENTSF